MMPGRGRSFKRRAAYINSAHHAPSGTPKPSLSKIQVLSRPALPLPVPADSPRSPTPPDNDHSEMAPLQGRILDDNGPPRSSAPISLEDLVIRAKPSRNRGNRGLKTAETQGVEDDKSQPQRDSFERSASAIWADDSTALNRLPIESQSVTTLQPGHKQTTLKSSTSYLETTSAASGLCNPHENSGGAEGHQSEIFEDGSFHKQTLENGDLLISQWSQANQKWHQLGQIGQGDVSLFTRFYDRSYSDNHANAENWKLYKEHIVATVKQLSQKRRDAVISANQTRSLVSDDHVNPSHNQNFRPHHEHLRARQITAIPEDLEFFPSLSAFRRHAPSTESNPNLAPSAMPHDTSNQLQHYRNYQNALDSSADFQYQRNRGIYSFGNQQDVTFDEMRGRDEYRDLERQRIHQNLLQQYHRNNAPRLQERAVSYFQPSESDHRLQVSRAHVEPPPFRSPSSAQDMRRTVLHDPLKAALSSLNSPKEEPTVMHAIGHGAPPPSANSKENRNIPSRSTVEPDTLRELVDVSEPLLMDPKDVEFFVRQNEDSNLAVSNYSAKIDDKLRACKPFKPKARLFSQDSKGPVQPLDYEESLEQFWTSGLKRQNGYSGQADKILARRNGRSDVETQVGTHLMIPVYESFAAYQFSKNLRAAGGQDNFANFLEPPECCIDKTPAEGKSVTLFGEQESTETLEPLENNSAAAQIPLMGLNRSLGTLGIGLRLPAVPPYNRAWAFRPTMPD